MSKTGRSSIPAHTYKPRVFIVSDISNEPDDAESLCRYLLYSNQFRTRGFVACTSTWMRDAVHPEDMEKIIRAYAKVVDKLNVHAPEEMQYSPPEDFLSILRTGKPVYGLKAINDGEEMSDGAKLLVERVDESDEEIWVLCWGGTNVILEALRSVDSRSKDDASNFRSKLRVYAISDQDDTGPVIRRDYPDIFYIASVHGWNFYGNSTWVGISGDKFYNFDQGGPDFTKMEHSWIKENIQVGPLGEAYPNYLFACEGDTPTFLYLIQNGLASPENPSWGSWGGRYVPSEEGGRHFGDTKDVVVGTNGATHTSAQASIWRWRDAFQNDFAARIQWTMSSDFGKVNHAPVVSVNGSGFGPEHIELDAEAGSVVELDASESYDPDEGDKLSFRWFHYRDVSATQSWLDAEIQEINFENADSEVEGRKVKVTLPAPGRCAFDMKTQKALSVGQKLHVILEVKDNGTPALVTYKRIVIQCTNKDLRTDGSGGVMDEIFKMVHEMQKKGT